MQQAAVPHTATIHTPETNVDALYRTCMDLKQAVEELQGFREEADFRPRMTVSSQPPDIVRDGEFWLSEGTANVVSVSYQGVWRRLGPIT